MDPNAAKPDNPNIVNSPDPLSNLQNVVDAAKEAAAAQTTAPLQTPTETPQVQTPQVQFENQFGSGITPPVAEAPSSSVAQLDPSINTVDDLLAKGPQVVEAVAPPEQTPAERLKQKIADSVDAFLAEVTKEKVAA